MRFKYFLHASACALLISSMSSVADAKPKRPAATSAAKKKAAAAAAKKEADRLAAQVAAEAAEKARVRAQWGLLADIGEADFEYKNIPVTFRRSADGNSIDITTWSNFGRGTARISRDPATGVVTYFQTEPKGGSIVLTAAADRSLETKDSNGVRWPVFKAMDNGVIQMMPSPTQSVQFKPLAVGGKAAARLTKLIAARKVEALDSAPVSGGATTGAAIREASASPSTGQVAIRANAVLEGSTDQGGFWEWPWKKSCFPVEAAPGEAFRVDTQMFGDRSVLELSKGCTFGAETVIIKDNAGDRGNLSMRFTQRNDPLFVRVWKRGSGKKFKVQMSPLSKEEVAAWGRDQEAARLAELKAKQEKAASGNSGLLGGLIMGGVAAAMGGDAGMVMGATMKGVEMTTDNEMSRAVLAGQGDAMIQSSIDTKNQIAETERLRVAAQEETRRKSEAASAGRTSSPTVASRSSSSAPAAKVGAWAAQGASKASSLKAYSICFDHRTDRSTGKIREVIFYSAMGTILPGPSGGIGIPSGFDDFVDTQTPLKRSAIGSECVVYDSIARAESDLAIKRQIERPGVRDFVHLPTWKPR